MVGHPTHTNSFIIQCKSCKPDSIKHHYDSGIGTQYKRLRSCIHSKNGTSPIHKTRRKRFGAEIIFSNIIIPAMCGLQVFRKRQLDGNTLNKESYYNGVPGLSRKRQSFVNSNTGHSTGLMILFGVPIYFIESKDT